MSAKPKGVLSFWNVPADADDPDIKVYVNGALVEGSSSSDISIATITIREPDVIVNPDARLTVAYLDDYDNCVKATGEIISLQDGAIIRVPLYKGKQIGSYSGLISSTGGVTLDGEGWIIITGDGEITGW